MITSMQQKSTRVTLQRWMSPQDRKIAKIVKNIATGETL